MAESPEKKNKTLVIIPAFNEEEQVATVLQGVKQEVPEAIVLVVNDGSSDQTEAKVRAAGAKVLSHPFNMGYGVTLQTGYKYALKHGFEYILQMDGDGQHDPRYLPILLREIEEREPMWSSVRASWVKQVIGPIGCGRSGSIFSGLSPVSYVARKSPTQPLATRP